MDESGFLISIADLSSYYNQVRGASITDFLNAGRIDELLDELSKFKIYV
jgi:hypothetical protein